MKKKKLELDFKQLMTLVEASIYAGLMLDLYNEVTGKGRKKKMPTAKELLDAHKGTEGARLLHGSDLPRKLSGIILDCTAIRVAPDNFNSPAIMDFKPVEFSGVEYAALALNKTNLKVIIELLGEEVEIETLSGKASFTRILVNNPQTKQPTHGLLLTGFKVSGAKRPKAGPASRRGGKGAS